MTIEAVALAQRSADMSVAVVVADYL